MKLRFNQVTLKPALVLSSCLSWVRRKNCLKNWWSGQSYCNNTVARCETGCNYNGSCLWITAVRMSSVWPSTHLTGRGITSLSYSLPPRLAAQLGILTRREQVTRPLMRLPYFVAEKAHRRVESLLKLLSNDSAEKCRLFCLSQQHSSAVQQPDDAQTQRKAVVCCWSSKLWGGGLDLVTVQFFLPCGFWEN
jgi:hypothetical protein